MAGQFKGNERSENQVSNPTGTDFSHDPHAEVRGTHVPFDASKTVMPAGFPVVSFDGDHTSTALAAGNEKSMSMLTNAAGNPTESNQTYGKADAEKTAVEVGKFSPAELKAMEENMPADAFVKIMKHMQENPNDQNNIEGWKSVGHDLVADQALDDAHTKYGLDNDQIKGLKKLAGDEGLTKTIESWNKMDPADAQQAAKMLKEALNQMLGKHEQ